MMYDVDGNGVRMPYHGQIGRCPYCGVHVLSMKMRHYSGCVFYGSETIPSGAIIVSTDGSTRAKCIGSVATDEVGRLMPYKGRMGACPYCSADMEFKIIRHFRICPYYGHSVVPAGTILSGGATKVELKRDPENVIPGCGLDAEGLDKILKDAQEGITMFYNRTMERSKRTEVITL